MNKLGALVEERRVVFVCLDDKILAATQPGRQTKVGRHPTNQEAWLKTRMFKNPCQHAGSACLPMSPCHRQHPAILEHMSTQPFRARGIGQPVIQHGFYHRLASGERIADDDLARDRVQLRRLVAIN